MYFNLMKPETFEQAVFDSPETKDIIVNFMMEYHIENMCFFDLIMMTKEFAKMMVDQYRTDRRGDDCRASFH